MSRVVRSAAQINQYFNAVVDVKGLLANALGIKVSVNAPLKFEGNGIEFVTPTPPPAPGDPQALNVLLDYQESTGQFSIKALGTPDDVAFNGALVELCTPGTDGPANGRSVPGVPALVRLDNAEDRLILRGGNTDFRSVAIESAGGIDLGGGTQGVSVASHLMSNGGAATVSGATATVNGNAIAGKVTAWDNDPATPVTIELNGTTLGDLKFTNPPAVLITPTNSATAAAAPYVSAVTVGGAGVTSSFQVTAATGDPLAFDYMVIGEE